MGKVLAFSILSASPADIAAGANTTGGIWARLSWRSKKPDDQTAEAEQQQQQQQLGEGKPQQSQAVTGEARRPRLAPEFDGIDCFETIVWR